MRKKPLWTLGLLLLAYVVALGVIWGRDVPTRQDQVVATMIATFVAAIALLIWFVAASGARTSVRVGGVLVVIAAAAFVATQYQLDVTGDVAPILEARGDELPAVDAPENPPPIFAFITTPGDSEQFLGPRRDGSYTTDLEPDWETYPPEELWRKEIGAGWSSFAVVGEVGVTQEQRGDNEYVVAYDILTGNVLWAHDYAARYESTIAGTGPRATPTIWGNNVWTMGSTGILSAVELVTGKPRWSVNVIEDQGGTLQQWGKSSSPLIHDDLVIVTGGWGGPNLIAYDRQTGEFRWRADAGQPDYSSPLMANIQGRNQIVVFNADSVSAHVPRSGETLWTAPWETGQPTVAQPLILGNLVLASSGYGRGAKLFGIQRQGRTFNAQQLWASLRLKSKFANFVQYNGYVYGLDDGVLTCIDPADGERLWKAGRYGHGQLIVSRGMLLIQAENGDLVLVEATPEEHRELHRVEVFDRKTWNTPALVGDVLLLRNDREAVGLRLARRMDAQD